MLRYEDDITGIKQRGTEETFHRNDQNTAKLQHEIKRKGKEKFGIQEKH